MAHKFSIIALAFVAFGFALVARSNAGTDMIIDNSAQAPLPRQYNYAPPPPRIYYAPTPPPVAVIVSPAYRYYAPGVRVCGVHQHGFARRVVRPFHHDYRH
jgi:hypothetical protein